MKLSELDTIYVLHNEETDELYARQYQVNPGIWATAQGASCAKPIANRPSRLMRQGKFAIKALKLVRGAPNVLPGGAGDPVDTFGGSDAGGRARCEP